MATQSTTIEVSHLDTRLVSPTLPIVLRTTLPSDAARFAAILSDPANSSDPHAGQPLDPATASSIITKQRASAAVPTVLDPTTGRVLRGPPRVNMVVELLSSSPGPLVIGLGGFGAVKDWTRAGRAVRAGDVGAMIDPAHRGRGYATEAIRLAIEWAFTPAAAEGGGPQLDLVTLTTSADNEAMVRLAGGKLGLRGRGTRRPSEEEGQEGVTELYYELTKEDWQEIVAAKKGVNA
ncbi:Acyl-CoA N-acyltransferase [Cordyceps fumosorosea ARSEF 2679]|uniref:Acyl-CoA N-acyltransferase n=1 Tax=Cordyceps fumosorosea (strain ARSEF 2679) TaxID=1081104 RepID=A0A168AKL1_CORFA|nr:Acyl-CoA N-acyltransferase [Cordyceps fumosorosea ARSEF 2679]OAA68877.1 Acyl-CoA N-acyltransferase [Cordyceps fumosorosea ARSEF 2679]